MPSTHIKQLTVACNSNSRGSDAVSKGTLVYMHIPHNNKRKCLLTPDRAQQYTEEIILKCESSLVEQRVQMGFLTGVWDRVTHRHVGNMQAATPSKKSCPLHTRSIVSKAPAVGLLCATS